MTSGRRVTWRVLLATGARHPFVLVPFLFYWFTCAPGMGASDPALMVDEIRNLKISTHANHHNFTLVLGWVFSRLPHDDPAYNANLVSVLLGGLAVSLFYALVVSMFGSRPVAVSAAALLMVSHSMWWHSTIIEAYAANALFTVAALFLLHRLQRRFTARALSALFFVAGLALFNHAQMGILLVGAGAVLAVHAIRLARTGQGREAARTAAGCLAGFIAGAVPYALTFVSDARRHGSVSHALSLAMGSDFRAVMLQGEAPSAVQDLLLLLAVQFPSPFLAAVAYGCVRWVRAWRGSPSLAGVAVLFALNTGFFMFYRTWDKFAFLLPSFIVLALGGAFGVESLYRLAGRKRAGTIAFASLSAGCVALPIYAYARAAEWGERAGFWSTRFSNARPANTVDVARYLSNPNKRSYREYEEFARALFERLPPQAVLVDDDSRTFYPLRFFQTYRGLRPDVRVELVNSWGFRGWGLEVEQFGALLDAAWRRDMPLFMTSISFPLDRYVLSLPEAERYRFEKFPLRGGRWVYRLLTAADQRRSRAAEPPAVEQVAVGVDLDRAPPSGRATFRASDTLMAAVYFEINGEPFPLRFRWTRPDRQVLTSEPVVVPFACRSAWSRLDAPGPLPAGWWSVEAWSGERRLGETRFLIQ